MIAMKQRGITDAGRGSVLVASAASLVLVVIATDARAQAQRGSFVYASAEQCASDRKISQEFCANAAANAAAEFDEKAPRFPAREACERVFGAGRCSLGFGGPGAGPGTRA